MSHSFDEQPHNAITDSGIARVIPCKELDWGDPLHWLALGFKDILKAPFITVFYGIFFALVPWLITYLVQLTGWHLVILPAMVCFMMMGPLLAAGLYDVSWELEKGHKPSIWHSLKATHRNSVNEWGFGLLLAVIMIFWLRIASLVHALYPPYLDPNLENLLPFLLIGTLIGVFFTTFVFAISVFTQPILMERKVDIATAVLTSVNAVWVNKGVMTLWAAIIFGAVLIGFITGFVGLIILMPLIGYSTWHAYIDCIETKIKRKYE